MKHMKRDRDNTLCMLYLPRVKDWSPSIRDVECPACKKQVRDFINGQITVKQDQIKRLEQDLAWFEMWEEDDVQS